MPKYLPKRSRPAQLRHLDQPTFEEYFTARKVVLFVAEELRQENGQFNIGSDEMVARIIARSCPHFRRPEEVLSDPLKDHRVPHSDR